MIVQPESDRFFDFVFRVVTLKSPVRSVHGPPSRENAGASRDWTKQAPLSVPVALPFPSGLSMRPRVPSQYLPVCRLCTAIWGLRGQGQRSWEIENTDSDGTSGASHFSYAPVPVPSGFSGRPRVLPRWRSVHRPHWRFQGYNPKPKVKDAVRFRLDDH